MARSNIKIKRICQWCGQEFYAQRVTTRYCSKKCNERAYKANLRQSVVKTADEVLIEQTVEIPRKKLNEKTFLDVKEVAFLLGISGRAAYDLIEEGKLRAVRMSTRMTLVRRSDIDAMFDSHPYVKRHRKKKEEITEFYTIDEIREKYGVSTNWIYKVGKEKNIPRIVKRGKTYWSKTHIDKFITSNKADDSITEWYSVSDLMEKFNMTQSAVYSFVYERNIPKKKVKNEVFYSKKHVDIAKGIAEPEKAEYYVSSR